MPFRLTSCQPTHRRLKKNNASIVASKRTDHKGGDKINPWELLSSGWFQLFLKHIRKMGSFPQVGVKIQNI